MDKTLQKLILPFLAVFSFFSIAVQAKERNQIKIGISLPTLRDIGWVRYKEGFEQAAKKAGITALIQTGDQDPSQQASQVENLLSEGIDVLILAPQDAEAASSLVTAAHHAHVKVISLDRLILNSNVDFYISFDNEKVGELQGKYLSEVSPKGNYILLSGAPTDNNSKAFKEGAMKYLNPLIKKGSIKVLMDQPIDDWQPSAAQRLVENSLTAHQNNVQAILAPNDNTAGGVIQALASQGLAKKVYVTGQDTELSALQRIVAGTQSMTVFKNQNELAEKAFGIAVNLANGKVPAPSTRPIKNGKYTIPSLLLDPVVIDKKNIDDKLIKTGTFSKTDVYKYTKG